MAGSSVFCRRPHQKLSSPFAGRRRGDDCSASHAASDRCGRQAEAPAPFPRSYLGPRERVQAAVSGLRAYKDLVAPARFVLICLARCDRPRQAALPPGLPSPGGGAQLPRPEGRDIFQQVNGYELRHRAGRTAELLLFLSPLVKDEFDGLARVYVGVPPDPGPAAGAFLSAIDAGELERQVLSRHDLLDGGPHELARAMLLLLQEWVSGRWQPEVTA